MKYTPIGRWPMGPRLHVQGYSLQNGLRVLVLADRSAPVVSYQTWFRVGSRHERPGKTGLAHLFEHLMFNETKNLPYGTFDRMIESVGGETNAATWVDWTFYYENIPSQHVSLVVELEAERMSNLVLRDKQVSSEKEVVANERRFRVDDDIEGSASEALYKAAFTTHPYHWPTIGWMADIEAFTTKDCEAFYRTYYAPNNATIVVAGDVVPEALMKVIHQKYGTLMPALIPVENIPDEPLQKEEKLLTMRKPTPTEKLLLGYKSPPFGHRDHAVLSLMNEVLVGGRSSRLYRALVSEGELATEVRGSVSPFKFGGLYELWVSMREGVGLERGLEIIDAALETLCHKVVKPSELERVKNRMELQFLQGLETASGKAEQIGFYDTVWGQPDGLMQRLAQYREVTADEIQEAARRYTSVNQRTRIHVVPDSDRQQSA